MRCVGLLMLAGVIGCSNGVEGENQVSDGGQRVEWVTGGIDSKVPPNAIRDSIGDGLPLCRGNRSQSGNNNGWQDIGVRKDDGLCHTLNVEEHYKAQESFFYLVPAHEGGMSTAGMVPETEVQAAVDMAVAKLTAQMEREVEMRMAEATKRLVAWGWDATGVIKVAEAEVRAEMAEKVEYWKRRCNEE
jgi:hypothetical protein